MYAYQAIQQALSPLAMENGWPLEPDVYDGDAVTYITYNEADNRSSEFGDDDPLYRTVDLQIHFFTPLYKPGTKKKTNYLPHREAIREALYAGGFTYPEVAVRADTDLDPQASVCHIVFECEYVENIEPITQ